MNTQAETCALCPHLCRHRCPVSVASGREAATPTAMLTAAVLAVREHADPDVASRAVDLCTGCGACTDVCGIDAPVVDLLRTARTILQPAPDSGPLQEITGSAERVAVVCGDQDWSAALAAHIGTPLASIRTSDHLGELSLLHNTSRSIHLKTIQRHFEGRTAVASCHGCLSVLTEAEIEVTGIWTLISPLSSLPSFHVCGEADAPSLPARLDLACCGAGNPLASRHPDVAREVGRGVARRLAGQPVRCDDSRCAAHLRACGATIVDPIQTLLDMEEPCP